MTIFTPGRRSRASRFTSGPVGLNGAPGKGPKPVMRMVGSGSFPIFEFLEGLGYCADLTSPLELPPPGPDGPVIVLLRCGGLGKGAG